MQYPIWTKFGALPDAPEVTINFLCALLDFTEENGAIRVIPESHKWPDHSVYGQPEDTIAAEMKSGDALFISGKTVHGGGHNRSNEKRRGLAFSWQPSYLTPEEAYPFMIPVETVKKLSPRAQRMVGFRSQSPWRLRACGNGIMPSWQRGLTLTSKRSCVYVRHGPRVWESLYMNVLTAHETGSIRSPTRLYVTSHNLW